MGNANAEARTCLKKGKQIYNFLDKLIPKKESGWHFWLPKSDTESNQLYLEEMRRKNMRIHTLTRLLLPSLFLLVLSLMTGVFLFAFHESLHPNSSLVAGFLALLFLILALINLKRMHLDGIRGDCGIEREEKLIYRQIQGKGVRHEKNLIVVGNGVFYCNTFWLQRKRRHCTGVKSIRKEDIFKQKEEQYFVYFPSAGLRGL